MLFVKVFDNFDLQRSSPKSSISCSQFTDNIDNNPSNIPLTQLNMLYILWKRHDESERRTRMERSFRGFFLPKTRSLGVVTTGPATYP